MNILYILNIIYKRLMLNKILLIIICMIIIYIINELNINEYFNNDTNLFFRPVENIFLANNPYNYEFNRPEIIQKTKPLSEISFNSFLYSQPIGQRIICASHKNRANCWEDNFNNCQWVHRIDGNSYCEVGPVMLL